MVREREISTKGERRDVLLTLGKSYADTRSAGICRTGVHEEYDGGLARSIVCEYTTYNGFVIRSNHASVWTGPRKTRTDGWTEYGDATWDTAVR
jgi:hypothetical protein